MAFKCIFFGRCPFADKCKDVDILWNSIAHDVRWPRSCDGGLHGHAARGVWDGLQACSGEGRKDL